MNNLTEIIEAACAINGASAKLILSAMVLEVTKDKLNKKNIYGTLFNILFNIKSLNDTYNWGCDEMINYLIECLEG
jgi:hypothetical protein